MSDKKETDCPFFVIFSNKTTNELKNDISNFLGLDLQEIEKKLVMRVHFKNREQTNTTFFITNDTISNFLSERSSELSEKYGISLRKFLLQDVENPVRELFIPFPKKDADPAGYNLLLKTKLSVLCPLLELTNDNVYIHMRKNSRINDGEYKNFCLIKFNESVDQDIIYILKIMLHDSLWKEDNEKLRVRCMWSKNQKNANANTKTEAPSQ